MLGCVRLPVKTHKRFKSSYTYETPVYGMPYTKKHYSCHWDSSNLHLPRNLIKLRGLGLPTTGLKLLTVKPNSEIKFNPPYALYDYQQRDLDKVVKMFNTDINVLFRAPTRYGKVIFILGLIASLQQRTLIVVDKTLLVTEFIKETNKFTNAKIEQLTKTNVNGDADILITTVQFLHRNQNLLKDLNGLNGSSGVGMLVVDEVHSVVSKSYVNVVNSLGTRYRFGLSATPTNSNNLEGIITDLFEPVKLIGVNPNDIKVNLEQLHAPRNYNPFNKSTPRESYVEFWTDVSVVNSVIEDIKKYPKDVVFVATPSKEVQYCYAEALRSLGREVVVFNSDATSKTEHTLGLERINNNEANSMVGFGVLTKGVSVKMDRLYSLDAASTKEPLRQLIGRLKTPYKGKKTPVVVQVVSKFQTRKDTKIFNMLKSFDDINYSGGQDELSEFL